MSNVFGLISEETYVEKMDTLNLFLSEIAKGEGSEFKPQDWAHTQALVRTGLIDRAVGIGDQFISERGATITVTVGHTEETESGITGATIVPETFIAAMGGTVHKGEYEFIYNGAEWHYNNDPVVLADYGITINGDPVHGDDIIVHETTTSLTWDVIGKNHDTPTDPQYTKTMTLAMHDQWGAAMQFDAAEALFAFPSGLTAGTYNFTVGAQPWYAGDVNKTIQFTISQDIPAGGQLRPTNLYNTTMIGKNIAVYASPTDTTATESVAMSEGSEGTSLGTVTRTVTGDINSIDRVYYGSNNYKESAIRQWLNSDKPAGQVWSPQTKWDRPPSWAATADGFMHNMDADFLAVVGKTHIVTARAVTYEGGAAYDEMDDYFFLLSRSQVYGGKEVSAVDEGSPYPYFSDYSDLNAAGTGADRNRIKYKNGTAAYWWLRTPVTANGNIPRFVSTAGVVNYYHSAYYAYGVLPACNII